MERLVEELTKQALASGWFRAGDTVRFYPAVRGWCVVLAVLALSGCPGMPAPDGCTPLDRRCHEDTPQVCSPGQRWTPADVRCGTVGASCVVTDGGAPACLAGGAQ